ncbi:MULTISPECIES: SAM-dependent methyltransferase [unclassified Nonomuraea]|uniref:SAM-dependent methyltransferase n=1 Tax=unclassified Nonomuraea TaxID=2593643 RepID=UPI0033D28EB9
MMSSYGECNSHSLLSPPPATQAGVYSALLGGGSEKDAYQTELTVADELENAVPGVKKAAGEGRKFIGRAALTVGERGLSQFIDLGSGLPRAPYLHEIVRRDQREAKVVYVDHDPRVCRHGWVHLKGEGLAMVQEDIREIDRVLANKDLLSIIDLDKPVAVVLGAICHFLTDEETTRILETLREILAPDSAAIVTHATTDGATDQQIAAGRDVYTQVSEIHLRSRRQIQDLLSGWDLMEPGVVNPATWFPYDRWAPLEADPEAPLHMYGAVAWLLPSEGQAA